MTKPQSGGVNVVALMAALSAAGITASFESAMVVSALKTWFGQFGDPAHVRWMISWYMLIAAGVAAICGRLGDIFGRSRMLCIVLA